MSTNPREELEQFFREFGEPFTIVEDPVTGELSGFTSWAFVGVDEVPACRGAERRRAGGRRRRRRSR
jgi:hypothetical protein